MYIFFEVSLTKSQPNVRVHWGGDGQAASALSAAHVIGFAPSTLKPSLHVNVALLPWLSTSLLLTSPFVGALALGPVHCVRVQVPLGVAPLQVIVPLNPGLHSHEVPAALLEFAISQSAAVDTRMGISVRGMVMARVRSGRGLVVGHVACR